MADDKPFAEDLLGDPSQFPENLRKAPLPYAEDLLGPKSLYEANHFTGSYWDEQFGQSNESLGSLYGRFTKGFSENMPDAFGLDKAKIGDKSITQHLRDYGVFPDKSQNLAQVFTHPLEVIKNFNEGVMRGTVGLADYALNSAYAFARGWAAIGEGRGNLAKTLALPGDILSGIFEAFPAGHATGFPAEMPPDAPLHRDAALETAMRLSTLDSPHPTINGVIESLNASQTPRGGPNQIVLPETPRAPDPLQTQRDLADRLMTRSQEMRTPDGKLTPDALKMQNEARLLRQKLEQPPEPTETVSPPKPAVIEQLDNLVDQRKQLSDWLQEHLEPTTFNIGGVEVPAQTPLQEVPTAAARSEEAGPTGQQAAQASIVDQLRQGINEIDKRIDSLMPEVKATHEAAGPPIRFEINEPQYTDPGLRPPGEPTLAPGVSANPGGGFDIDTTEGKFYAKTADEAEKIASQYEVLTQRRPTIAQQVYRDLSDVSTMTDTERRANAALVQAHYEARAARFEGRLGSARDLFESEYPTIKASDAAGKVAGGSLRLSQNTITMFRSANPSTLMHESAHAWFEEMLRDGARDDAPPELKEDVDAVRAWLQMQGDRPTRAQHEQFATGFEQYLREGIAPSSRLGGVFEKFKNWLTKIYQTVRSLGAPISDEMRGVYDRLLSAKREEVVVQPTRELGRTFDRVHTDEAGSTPPELAIEKANEIAAERNDIASQLRAEIDAGRARARIRSGLRGATTERTPGGTAIPGGSPENVRPGAGGAGAGSETEAQRGGGVSPTVEREPVTSPNQSAGPGDTRLVDKAGNIRLDNLSAPDDVEQAIRESARLNRGFGLERRGILTDADILELSRSLGRDAAFLDRKTLGEAFNAEEIVAARVLLRQSEIDVRAAMQEVNRGGDEVKLLQAIARNEMIQGKVAQATAEWGRAGRAFRSLATITKDQLSDFLKDNKGDIGRTYDQLLQAARHGEFLNDVGQMNNFIRVTHGARFPILYYYLNSLLSGPITHTVYAIGNELRAVAEPFTAGFQAAIGSARGATTDRVHWQEVSAAFYALGKGHLEGWRAARSAFQSGIQTTLPGLRGFVGGPLTSPLLDEAGASYGTGFKRMVGGIAAGDMSEAGRGLVQTYGLPYRSVTSIHSFGVTLRYYQALARYATRQALDEGLAGDALRTRIAKLSAEPTETLMRQAYGDSIKPQIQMDVPQEVIDWAKLSQKAAEEAMRQMYMRVYDYHSPAANIIRGMHSNPYTAFIVPFAKVGLEIQRESYVRHTPVGFLSKEVRGEIGAGGAAQDEALGRMAFGASLLGGGALLSAMGAMTGPGPVDPDERAVWSLNHTPESLQLGPITIPMRGLPVVGSLLSFGASLYEAADTHGTKPEFSQLIKNYLHAFTHAAFDEGVFHDIADIGEIIHDPQQHLGQWLLNTSANFIPWSVGLGQVTRFGFDPYSKDIHGFDAQALLDTWRRQIPGQSQYVPNRVDVFGNPILSRGSWAIHYAQYQNDPVVKMLEKAHIGIGQIERNIEGVELTTQEHSQYATVAGRLTYQMLQTLPSPGFDSMPENMRRYAVHNIVVKAREAARAYMTADSVKNNPQENLVTKARDKKLEILR